MSFTQAWNLLARKMIAWGRDFVLLLPNLGLAILALFGFWLVARGLRSLAQRLLRRVSQSEQVGWLIAQTLYLAVLVVGLSVALGILGLQKTVASLLAGAGLVGLALGFAFQDIAANLMAGIYLSIQRPFRRGQLVKTQDYFGVVKEVTLRWTEIISQQGQMILIPNKQVFENPIMNYSHLGRRRVDLTVGVSYGDDLEKVRQIAMQAVEGVTGRLPDREIELFYEEFGESSIDFTIRFWIEFKRQTDYLLARSEAIMRIKEAFDANGITLPFPTRTLDFAVKGGETLAEILEEAGVGSDAPAERRPVR